MDKLYILFGIILSALPSQMLNEKDAEPNFKFLLHLLSSLKYAKVYFIDSFDADQSLATVPKLMLYRS